MSQKDLAIALGVTPQAVSAWVHGVATPGLAYMVAIEKLLGIPVAEWLPDVANLEPIEED